MKTEAQIEDLARTVTCPVCDAQPGLRCRYGNGTARYSHTARLKLARGEPL